MAEVKALGRRVGKKKSDKRWQDPTGQIWDSQFEYIVYTAYKAKGANIRRCGAGDTMAYTLSIRQGACLSCGSTEIGQRRTYTPDFLVTPKDTECKAKSYYIETKGYLRAKERALLRAVCKAYPDIDIRIVFQRNYRVTKPTKSGDGSVIAWAKKFLKPWKISVWSGQIEQ